MSVAQPREGSLPRGCVVGPGWEAPPELGEPCLEGWLIEGHGAEGWSLSAWGMEGQGGSERPFLLLAGPPSGREGPLPPLLRPFLQIAPVVLSALGVVPVRLYP